MRLRSTPFLSPSLGGAGHSLALFWPPHLPWRLSVLVFFLLPVFARAADARPIVGPGATKEEILDAYGWPSGTTQAGDKEILTYPQGRVVLEKGKVEVVDFSLNVPWPAPRPRPGTGIAGTGDSWYSNWPEALKEAKRRRTRILALFVGSDWSPPSRQFLAEVSEAPDFLTAFWGSFILVKLDYPRTTQPKALHAQNTALREQFEVTTYPSLLILEPDGRLAMRIDLSRPHPGDTYRAQVISAAREARDLLSPVPGTLTSKPGATAAATDAANSGASGSDAPPAVSLGMAGVALSWWLGGGISLAVFLFWFAWRFRPRSSPMRNTAAERVAEAASGLPTAADMDGWSHAQLCAVVAGIAECDDYAVTPRSGGAEGDLTLTRRGEDHPAVIVACAASSTGTVPAKRLRELYGTATLEGVRMGWFVAMGGFSNEAKHYAQEQDMVLLTRDMVREQLRGLMEQDLAKVLARMG